jgi:hypothetical protein
MSYKVYSVEMLKEERRKQTVEEKVPYIGPDGRENFVTKKDNQRRNGGPGA